MSAKPHRVGGTSPAKIRAVLCDPLATANTATIIVKTLFGRGFKPNAAQARCDGLGAGVASTLDIQVGGVSILSTPIVIGVVNTVYPGLLLSGTAIPNNTDVSFIFSNTSGGNMLGATASITGEVAHSA